MFSITWHKIKEETDQISRDFCLLVLSWNSRRGKVRPFTDKRPGKGQNQRKNWKTRQKNSLTSPHSRTSFKWNSLYTSFPSVAFRLICQRVQRKENFRFFFRGFHLSWCFFPCCRIRSCHNRPVACPHMYLPDCQRLSRQVYVMLLFVLVGHFSSSDTTFALTLF